MKTICTWCDRVLQDGPAEPVSHGICPACVDCWEERYFNKEFEMKKIRVIVKNGTFKVETTGYTGTNCHDATARLEERLGLKLTDEPTAEMYEQEADHEQEAG
jgi:hypothetical protein